MATNYELLRAIKLCSKTQEQIAKELNVSSNTLSAWKHGKAAIPSDKLFELEHYFDRYDLACENKNETIRFNIRRAADPYYQDVSKERGNIPLAKEMRIAARKRERERKRLHNNSIIKMNRDR